MNANPPGCLEQGSGGYACWEPVAQWGDTCDYHTPKPDYKRCPACGQTVTVKHTLSNDTRSDR